MLTLLTYIKKPKSSVWNPLVGPEERMMETFFKRGHITNGTQQSLLQQFYSWSTGISLQ